MEPGERKDPRKKDGQQEEEKAAAEKTAPQAQSASTPLVQPIQSQIKETMPDGAENLIEVSDLELGKDR